MGCARPCCDPDQAGARRWDEPAHSPAALQPAPAAAKLRVRLALKENFAEIGFSPRATCKRMTLLRRPPVRTRSDGQSVGDQCKPSCKASSNQALQQVQILVLQDTKQRLTASGWGKTRRSSVLGRRGLITCDRSFQGQRPELDARRPAPAHAGVASLLREPSSLRQTRSQIKASSWLRVSLPGADRSPVRAGGRPGPSPEPGSALKMEPLFLSDAAPARSPHRARGRCAGGAQRSFVMGSAKRGGVGLVKSPVWS